MSAIVNKIEKNSIAEELEIQAGDEILSIDEQKLSDLIDYNFLCKSEFLTLEIKKTNGEIEIIELEKDFDEDLGIVFESAVFDKIKPCLNKCIFCFVDQQPKGLRDSLYIKDDDYRLSYLQGTYITLTNLTKQDKQRIESLGLGPFYISVHTTNPELRVKMLKNPNAADILKHLKWLGKKHIPVHLQIVLCPGYNDGEELKRTLSDLKKLKNILSIAIVPVGITKFRKENLNPVTKEIAIETIEIAEDFNKTADCEQRAKRCADLRDVADPFNASNQAAGKNIVCCSDEFFLIAEKPIPDKKYYGNFSQLEDGVGAIRLLINDFEKQKKQLPKSITKPLKIIFATSQLAKPAMEEISKTLNKIKNLETKVCAVKSNYWGENITVAGLITSEDLINSLKVQKSAPYSSQLPAHTSPLVIIPSVMLRPFTQDFLDGKTLDYVKEQTGLDFLVINDCYSTKEIVDFVALKK